MGVIEFFVIVVVVVVMAGLAVLAMKHLSPEHPAYFDKLVWGVALLIIIAVLVSAIGLLKYDPRIPSL